MAGFKEANMKTCPLCDATYSNQQTACPTDGAMLIESRDLEPGTVVRNKYRIVRTLGRGGMGTVYLADHILLGRRRALKFMSAELSQDAKFLKRFRLEALATIELHHHNIVSVVDLDQAEDGSPFIAMEYVEGQSLRDALADAPFPVERALSIARGTGLGLIVAHSQNIIHRDIKPENILLAQESGKPEVPKILDFGIAAMKESATTQSLTRGLMLTPEYAAPEQWKGIAAQELDGRVDLYALGGVLHEMLTGSTGLRAHTTEGWMYQHLQVTPEAPSKLRPELARWKGLDELVLRLLEKDRDRRTASAEEFVRELDAVRSGTAIPASGAKAVAEAAAPVPPAPVAHEERGLRDQVADLAETPPVAPPVTAPAVRQPAPVARKASGFTTFVIGASIVLALVIGAGWLFFHSQTQPVQSPQSSETSKAPVETSVSPPVSPQKEQPRNEGSAHPEEKPHATPPTKPPAGGETAAPTGGTPAATATDAERGRELFDAKRYHEAFPFLERAAEAGDAYSQNQVGWMYGTGKGTAQDNARAIYWYRKAADQSFAAAEDNLGNMYDQGIGVAQDDGQAVYWYRKAADQGDATGEDNLGYMYFEGHGVEQDFALALYWFRKAAAAGSDAAMDNLGWMYEQGTGVAKDLDQAVSWYRKAAAMGNEHARKSLQRLGQ